MVVRSGVGVPAVFEYPLENDYNNNYKEKRSFRNRNNSVGKNNYFYRTYVQFCFWFFRMQTEYERK